MRDIWDSPFCKRRTLLSRTFLRRVGGEGMGGGFYVCVGVRESVSR